MEKILISACLAGDRVRYDGKQIPVTNKLVLNWKEKRRLIPVCPEILGNLEIPRPPAQIVNGDGLAVLNGSAKIVDVNGRDVTIPFVKGAERSLSLAQKYNITIAILKEKSPSCGVHHIYDGHFTSTLISGFGVTTAMFQENGIRVFSENELARVSALVD